MANNKDIFEVDLIEKDIIDVELNDKEFGNVNLNVIDILDGLDRTVTIENFIINEIPTQISSKRFQLANSYISGTLVIFFNGIKEKYIVEESDTDFSFQIDILAEDTIEVNYFKS